MNEQQADKKLSRTQRFLKEVREYGQIILLALFVTTFLFTTTAVAGSSMHPNLDGGVRAIRSPVDLARAALQGDRLFIPKYETWLRRAGLMDSYERGDIIVVREHADSPCKSTPLPALLIKRLVALPGDRIRIEAGEVFINSEKLEQGFITDNRGQLGVSNFPEMVIPEGEYFVLGDNRMGSCDSRIYGTIPFMKITGRASAIIWPPKRNGESNWRAIERPVAFGRIPNP